MGKLRTQMDNDMIVRGFSPRTRESYFGAVTGLAKHYRRSPDQISDEEVRAYLLHLIQVRKLSWSTCSVAVHGFRFFYHITLKRDRTTFSVPGPKQPSRLPEILNREEIGRLLAVVVHPKHRALLVTTYAAGLRVSEVVRLKVTDLDPIRTALRVEQGKGAKDRYTTLSPRLWKELQDYRKRCRVAEWLFPGRNLHKPMDVSTAQRIFEAAKRTAGLTKRGGIHSLRHAFATHLLEEGTDLHTIQRLMGHGHIGTTTRYLHVAQRTLMAAPSLLDLLAQPHAASE